MVMTCEWIVLAHLSERVFNCLHHVFFLSFRTFLKNKIFLTSLGFCYSVNYFSINNDESKRFSNPLTNFFFIPFDSSSVKKEKMSQNLLQWSVADVASYFSAAGFPEQAVAFRTQVGAPPRATTGGARCSLKLDSHRMYCTLELHRVCNVNKHWCQGKNGKKVLQLSKYI